MYDHCFNIIQTKKNEICYNTNSTIFFNDLINKKVINKIIDIHTMNFQMIAKDLLLIVDFEDFYVINTSKYNLVKKINILYSASSNIFSSYILNKNILLRDKIMQW